MIPQTTLSDRRFRALLACPGAPALARFPETGNTAFSAICKLDAASTVRVPNKVQPNVSAVGTRVLLSDGKNVPSATVSAEKVTFDGHPVTLLHAWFRGDFVEPVNNALRLDNETHWRLLGDAAALLSWGFFPEYLLNLSNHDKPAWTFFRHINAPNVGTRVVLNALCNVEPLVWRPCSRMPAVSDGNDPCEMALDWLGTVQLPDRKQLAQFWANVCLLTLLIERPDSVAYGYAKPSDSQSRGWFKKSSWPYHYLFRFRKMSQESP